MKKYIIVLLLFLFTSFSFAGSTLFFRGTSGGPSPPDIYDETFDTDPGYDNADLLSNEDVGASNILDEDDSNQYVSSPDSLYMLVGNAGNNCYTSDSVTEQTGVWYARVKLYIVDNFGATWSSFEIGRFYDGSASSYAIALIIQDNGSNPVLFLYNDSGNTEVTTTYGTWHTLRLKYNSDGSSYTQYKLDGGEWTNFDDAESNNRDIDGFQLGSPNYGLATTGEVYFDDFAICTSEAACE